jgi:hypothetical protein
LKWKFIQTPGSIRDPHRVKKFDTSVANGRTAQGCVAPQDLTDLGTHRQHRVQAGSRFLKDHADAPAAHFAHAGFGKAEQIRVTQPGAARPDTPVLRQEARDGECCHRFTAPGFTDQRIGFTTVDAHAHAVNGAHRRRAADQPGSQVTHLQQRH